MITYQNSFGKIRLLSELGTPYFYDPNAFLPNTKSGRFNTVVPPMLDGVDIYETSITGTQIRIEGRVYLRHLDLKRIFGRVPPMEKQVVWVRQFFFDLFNPNLSGILSFTDKSEKVYQLPKTRSAAAPVFGDYLSGTVPFTLELQSDNTYWNGTRFHTAMGFYRNGLRFPCRFPIRFAEYFGEEVIVLNDSPYPIYPIVIFNSNNTTYKIINDTTDKHLQLTHTVNQTQRMIVENSNRGPTITVQQRKNGQWSDMEDASMWLSADSDDFYFDSGVNHIRMDGGIPGTEPSVTIEWFRQYMGV